MNPQFYALLKAVVVGPLMVGISQQQGHLTQDEKDLMTFIGLGTIVYGVVTYFQDYGPLPDQALTAEPGEIIDVEATEVTPDDETAETPPADIATWPAWITPGYWWNG